LQEPWRSSPGDLGGLALESVRRLAADGAAVALRTFPNLASFDLTLSADHLKTLDEASRIDLGFPYDIYAKPIAQTSCYGGLRDQILA
jgi:hypothetical protein